MCNLFCTCTHSHTIIHHKHCPIFSFFLLSLIHRANTELVTETSHLKGHNGFYRRGNCEKIKVETFRNDLQMDQSTKEQWH